MYMKRTTFTLHCERMALGLFPYIGRSPLKLWNISERLGSLSYWVDIDQELRRMFLLMKGIIVERSISEI